MPTTPMSRMIYIRDGVTYSTVVPTQSSVSELQRYMLFKRKIGLRTEAILSVSPIQPAADFQRPSPAAKQFARYVSVE
jgi:hypothetical protein